MSKQLLDDLLRRVELLEKQVEALGNTQSDAGKIFKIIQRQQFATYALIINRCKWEHARLDQALKDLVDQKKIEVSYSGPKNVQGYRAV